MMIQRFHNKVAGVVIVWWWLLLLQIDIAAAGSCSVVDAVPRHRHAKDPATPTPQHYHQTMTNKWNDKNHDRDHHHHHCRHHPLTTLAVVVPQQNAVRFTTKRGGATSAVSSSTAAVSYSSSAAVSSLSAADLSKNNKKSKILVVTNNWKTGAIISAVSCYSTYALIASGKLPASRASALTAATVCFLARLGILPPPLAAASLSGAFTGMSPHLLLKETTTTTATTESKLNAVALSIITGLVFAYESSHQPNILTGKGGRLGTISVVAGLLYFALYKFDKKHSLDMISIDFAEHVRVVPAAFGISFCTILFSGILKTTKGNKLTPTEKVKFVRSAVKMSLVLFLSYQWFLDQKSGNSALTLFVMVLAPTIVIAVFALIQFYTPGNVASFCVMSFLASLKVVEIHNLSVPMIVGALIGMTKLPNFSVTKLVETSLYATLLLQSAAGGTFPGMGGRWGFFALVAVTLANLW